MTDQSAKQRIYSVDLLRGVVMMIMMLDHVREFVHHGALISDPTNPETTTVPIFFTRWITHFCAPIFVLLSGVSIFLQKKYGKTNRELSWFLLTRGLWLIVLEFTVVRFGIMFNVDYSLAALMQVIWVIGISMMVMAGLIWLPIRLIGVAGVAMIVLHNLLDRFSVPPQIAFSGQVDLAQSLWIIIHQIGVVPIGGTGSVVFLAYAIVPWVGVMMAGYWLGTLYDLDGEKRRRVLLLLGVVATAAFFILRGLNLYGDPSPWTSQETNIQSVLSFFNVTKYPTSLLFLLMTLGPGLIVLVLTDHIDGSALWQRVAITFGRVPMFYYLLQWYWAHGAGIVISLLAGKSIDYLFMNMPASGEAAPPDHGFSLGVTYLVWIVGLIALYPLCLWWGNLKQRNKHWALSYL